MSRRIEIEITSLSGDLATWRAAGAKLPKGVLAASLIPGGPVIGNVYRADIEQYMEGIEVLSVTSPKTASPLDPRNERIELIPETKKGPDVIVTYAPKGRGGRRDDRHEGRDGRDGPRRDSKRPSSRGDRKDAPTGTGERPPRGPRAERPPREEHAEGAVRERPARPRTERPGGRTGRPERPHGPQTPPLTTTHRNALLATLSPEQLPVAEQLLRGGMPAVRAAVELQNKNATAQGRPTIDAATIDRIAEDLLNRTNLAMWKDRAAGAIGAGRELRLRDLRAVVTSAKTVSLDEDARAQQKELQASLTARIEHLRTQWNEKLEAAITSKNVKEALSLVARPPDMSTRVSADAATRVVAMVSETLNADQDPKLWNEIVELTADTSIRRNVKPLGIPSDETSHAVAVHNAGAIPELAKLLGMKVPPPPPPTRIPRRPPTRRAS
jgi:ABC-type sugar transport system ATPase subunit